MASDEQALRDEIERLLAAALACEIDHARVAKLVAEAHQSELDQLIRHTQDAIDARDADHARQRDVLNVKIDDLETAITSRDLIGQAKGVLIVAMRCTADHALAVLAEQAQQENRKLVDVAQEVVERAQRRAVPHSSAADQSS